MLENNLKYCIHLCRSWQRNLADSSRA
jgi:hypothetical protein